MKIASTILAGVNYICSTKLVKNFHAEFNEYFYDTLYKNAEGWGDMGPIYELGAKKTYSRRPVLLLLLFITWLKTVSSGQMKLHLNIFSLPSAN